MNTAGTSRDAPSLETHLRRDELVRRFRELKTRTDRAADMLFRRYQNKVTCKIGCAECCTAINIHPFERAYIRRELTSRSITVDEHRIRGCRFRIDEVCGIYEHRPLICRLHGLVLAYPVHEYAFDGSRIRSNERIRTWCDLNFEGMATESFRSEDIIDMASIEAELSALDAIYLGDDITVHLVGLNEIPL